MVHLHASRCWRKMLRGVGGGMSDCTSKRSSPYCITTRQTRGPDPGSPLEYKWKQFVRYAFDRTKGNGGIFFCKTFHQTVWLHILNVGSLWRVIGLLLKFQFNDLSSNVALVSFVQPEKLLGSILQPTNGFKIGPQRDLWIMWNSQSDFSSQIVTTSIACKFFSFILIWGFVLLKLLVNSKVLQSKRIWSFIGLYK